MIRAAAYALHDGFIAPARPKSELWRFAVGMVVTFFAYIMLVQVFASVVLPVFGGLGRSGAAARTATEMYLILTSFGCMALAVSVTARLVHQRGFATLLGPAARFRQDFRAVSLAVLAVLAAVFVLPPWDMGAPFVQNMTLSRWLVLLAPSLIFLMIQVGAEEVLFRGYIQQQLAARFRSPLVWMVLPSLLFAAAHYDPQAAGPNALMIVGWAGIFGLLMADLTARAGSLGPALAVHFWNNVAAIMVVSFPDNLSGLSLYLVPFTMDDAEAVRAWLPVDFAMIVVFWLAARLAIRR